MKLSVDTECESCGGTGLYCGTCEPEGTAVVCLDCKGTGCYTVLFTPFKFRHNKKGIKIVRSSNENMPPKAIPYKEFQKGKTP